MRLERILSHWKEAARLIQEHVHGQFSFASSKGNTVLNKKFLIIIILKSNNL